MLGTLTCKYCGKQKQTKHYKESKYCSRKCWREAKTYLEEKNCEVCGKVFKKKSSLKAGRFCSQKCYWEYMVGNTRGENCNAYEDGRTKEDKIQRGRFRKQIQKLVLERDNYSCQICGQHGGHLQVDHIQPWAEYVELRFDMKNCRTLCQGCHYKVTYRKEMPKEIKAWGQNLCKI